MAKEGLVPTKPLSMAAIAKLLEDRCKSLAARVESHARSVFLQREIRQRMLQHLRESEAAHIGQSMGPLGIHDEGLSRARRELLIAALSQRP